MFQSISQSYQPPFREVEGGLTLVRLFDGNSLPGTVFARVKSIRYNTRTVKTVRLENSIHLFTGFEWNSSLFKLRQELFTGACPRVIVYVDG